MKHLSILAAVTLFVVNFYMAFMIGVQTGLAQTHTVNTVVLPPMDAPPRMPVVPKTPPEGQMQHMSYTFSEADEECMALNIYWEARDQDLRGKLAIGLVTLQRVASKHYPNTVCEVVWQKNTDRRTGKEVAQFSWTLDGKSDTPKNKKSWDESTIIASAFAGDGATIEDFTQGAYLYHADYVNPYWMDHYDQVATIGSHLFYK